MKLAHLEPEILYILNSSKDNKGKRVRIIYSGCENTLFSDDLGNPEALKLIGVEAKELALISQFLTG